MPLIFSRPVLYEDFEGASTYPYIDTTQVVRIGEKYLSEGLVPSVFGVVLAANTVETLTFADSAGGPYRYARSESRGMIPNVVVHTGVSGGRTGYRLGDVRRIFTLSFASLNAYLYGRLEAWCRYRVYGSSQTFMFTNSDGNSHLVRWTDGYSFDINSGAEWSYSHDLTLEVEL